MIEQIRKRLIQLHEVAPDAMGDLLRLEVLEWEEQTGECLMKAQTAAWMRNAHGVLHGGLCATIADQAMGTLVYCHRPGEGIAPSIGLQVEYHRPLMPEEPVLIRVRMLTVTRTLMRATAMLYRESAPDKLCVSACGTYYYQEPR